MDLYSDILDIEFAETLQCCEKKASDLAVDCARKLFERNGWHPEDFRVLVYGTQSPMFLTPSTASYLFKELGMSFDCLTYDIGFGSTSFSKGMQLISLLLNSFGKGEKGLLLLGDDMVDSLGIKGKCSMAAAVAVESIADLRFTILTKTFADYYESIYKYRVDSPLEIVDEAVINIKPYIEEMYFELTNDKGMKIDGELTFCTNCINLVSENIKSDIDIKNGKIISYPNNVYATPSVLRLLQSFDWRECQNLIICEVGAGIDISFMNLKCNY